MPCPVLSCARRSVLQRRMNGSGSGSWSCSLPPSPIQLVHVVSGHVRPGQVRSVQAMPCHAMPPANIPGGVCPCRTGVPDQHGAFGWLVSRLGFTRGAGRRKAGRGPITGAARGCTGRPVKIARWLWWWGSGGACTEREGIRAPGERERSLPVDEGDPTVLMLMLGKTRGAGVDRLAIRAGGEEEEEEEEDSVSGTGESRDTACTIISADVPSNIK